MFALFKNIIDRCDQKFRMKIDVLPDEGLDNLPTNLLGFIWFFIRQVKGILIGFSIFEVLFAGLTSVMFWYIGQLVEYGNYTTAMLWGGCALLFAHFFSGVSARIFTQLIYTPYFGNLVRRQLYWYTIRQSLVYFQNDFAGRIANKLLQSAPALRDVLNSLLGGVLFALMMVIVNLCFLFNADPLLTLPLVCWIVCYTATLTYYIPRIKHLSMLHSEDMSNLTGQVVDSFTNFLPIKYFARTNLEDRRVVKHLNRHSTSFRKVLVEIWKITGIIDFLNLLMVLSTAALGLHIIEVRGDTGIAIMAMALPMILQTTFQSRWIMFEISSIFENLGRVQEGIDTLTKPRTVVDKKGARKLKASKKKVDIKFDNVTFGYGSEDTHVLDGFDLHIPAGQKVGLVGKSGAGKSTIISLLVRAHDIEGGQILLDGQNIAAVTQDSLRENITVVTQESYLFHRSVYDNIAYGRTDATMADVKRAAKRANAHEFIMKLEDNRGRTGYDAHVGERGVKLSGGQKQRIGIARALLKEAPLLILDEATSALDSESEHAIQDALENIMKGKTVIAVAHRLSTLRQMDRIIVMHEGKIVEDGTHAKLIRRKNGHYAKLWTMQSGGFVQED